VILDKSQRTEHYSEADFLVHAGIPVSIDAVHAIAHNKVMVVDDETVMCRPPVACPQCRRTKPRRLLSATIHILTGQPDARRPGMSGQRGGGGCGGGSCGCH